MNFSKKEVEDLRFNHSPQPNYSREWVPSLIIQFHGGGFTISDWAGYLTVVYKLDTLWRCLQLEASGQGLLRELITGETATIFEPEIFGSTPLTIDNLEIEL